MKVEKIIGEDYCLYPTGWTISVKMANGKELNFPVAE
jgi:hypothetical protein